MADVKDLTKCITPEFISNYVSVFDGKANDKGIIEYSITMEFDADADLSALKKAYMEAGTAKFGTRWPAMHKAISVKRPVFKTEENCGIDISKHPDWEGKIIITAKTKDVPPGLIGIDRQPIIDKKDFVSGDIAVASLTAFAYSVKTDAGMAEGVSFGLNNVMKIRDGIPKSSRRNAVDDFAEYTTKEEEF